MKRATGIQEKEQRREQILAVAAELFRDARYGEVSMARIAAAAGIAKGTLYLSFATKEDLFLHLLLADLADWCSSLPPALPREPAALAQQLGGSLEQHPRLLRFFAILPGVLEAMVGEQEQTYLQFKRGLLAELQPLADALESQLPLPFGEGMHLLLRIHALVVGLTIVADQAAATLLPRELQVLQLDLGQELIPMLTALLRFQLRTS